MEQLNIFIKEARAKGKSDIEIRDILVKAGWQGNIVVAALNSNIDGLAVPLPTSSPTDTTTTNSTNTWDAFEHILLFISLYFIATSIALILHYFVDKYVPGISTNGYDSNSSSYYVDWQLTLFRGYLASLIVSLPLFSFFYLDIKKRSISNSIIKTLSARKTLTYITLVGAFVIMIGSIIGAVFNFLSGNVSINFVLHLLVTMSIGGIIFIHYLNQVKDDRKIHA